MNTLFLISYKHSIRLQLNFTKKQVENRIDAQRKYTNIKPLVHHKIKTNFRKQKPRIRRNRIFYIHVRTWSNNEHTTKHATNTKEHKYGIILSPHMSHLKKMYHRHFPWFNRGNARGGGKIRSDHSNCIFFEKLYNKR